MLWVSEVIEWTGAEVLKEGTVKEFAGLSTDTREDVMNKLFVALRGERYDGHDFIKNAIAKGASGIMCERIEELKDKVWVLKVVNTLYSLGEIARGYRRKKGFKVFGVTGSVGKTTTKELIWCILSSKGWTKNPGNYNNLIGVPLSILSIGDERGIVLEMAINAKGEMKRLCEIAEPDYALITRIGESHLEGLGTVDEVESEKGIIYESVPDTGAIFVNADDERVLRAAKRSRAQKVYYSTVNKDADVYGVVSGEAGGIRIDVRWRGDSYTFHVPHIYEEIAINALAAISVGFFFGVEPANIRNGLMRFGGVKGRMEVLKMKGLVLINDSYNANPVSFEAALRFVSKFNGRKILVGGDMLELGSYSEEAHTLLGMQIVKYGFSVVFYKGKMGGYVKTGIERVGGDVRFYLCDDEERWKFNILNSLCEGDVVLFKSSHRVGIEKVFDEVVRKLGGEHVS